MKSAAIEGTKIGFIGLGVMGAPMARHLANAGAVLTVHNRTRNKATEFAQGQPASQVEESAAELVRACPGSIIFLMLDRSSSVQEVVFGESGMLQADLESALIIDCGTTGLETTRRCAAAIRENGGDWVDAPVSGGQLGAERGRLTIMTGASQEGFQRALPYLEIFGEKITRLGKTGSGQIAKLANQLIVGVGISALAEAFALAKAAGVDPALIREAIRGGFAESRLLEEHGARMAAGNFQPGGRAAYQLKDIREACELMDDLEIDLPMLRQNFQLWQRMVERKDLGDLDHSGLYRLYVGEDGNS